MFHTFLMLFILDGRLNLAEGKLAFQSSTEVHDNVQHNASLATDGSTSVDKDTCSQTGKYVIVGWYGTQNFNFNCTLKKIFSSETCFE